MPIHDWTRVDDGIFHDFHHAWIEEIKRALNSGLLPDEYYALAEQYASRFGPDVLTLQGPGNGNRRGEDPPAPPGNGVGLLVAPPKVTLTGETKMEFYRRKQNAVAIRHVSGDRIVAMVEIVSPGNKGGKKPFRAFVEKACELLDSDIHLLIVDLHPPGRRDPQGIHGAIWEEITGEEYTLPGDKPMTLASYECDLAVRAYVEHLAVGDVLTDMPLFLEPGGHVVTPLEATYQTAFAAVPKRWRSVLEN